MSGRLLVACGRHRVGWLTRASGAALTFAYDDEWLLERRAFPLAQSLPLRDAPFEGPEAAAFFSNLLPEGGARRRIAALLGLSEANDFALLAAIGGDCAGALTVVDAERESERERASPSLLALSDADLADIIATPEGLPKVLRKEGVRLSLAGAQSKLPVVRTAKGLAVPLEGAPSTHILKLPSRDFHALPENEALMMRVASKLGLSVAPVELIEAGGATALLVTRYDRSVDENGTVRRLHQEDLCQALGLPPEQKYEDEGGPSFSEVYATVLRAVRDPLAAGQQMLLWLVFHVVCGDADGHAKNLALLRTGADSVELAPFYDLVCTRAYAGIHRRLAMGVGGEADPGQIRGASFDRLADEISVGRKLVRGVVREMAERAPIVVEQVCAELEMAEAGVAMRIAEIVRRQAKRVATVL